MTTSNSQLSGTPSDSTTAVANRKEGQGDTEINRHHFLMDDTIDSDVRGDIITGMPTSKNSARIYDEYMPASSQYMVSEDNIFSFKPVYDKPEIPNTRRYNFNSLQKWEGTVTEVGKESFWARLTDLNNSMDTAGSTVDAGQPAEEIVEIGNEDVSSRDDLELIRPGAIFYWNIGYQTVNGQDSKTSLIIFRRLPKWSARKKASFQQKGEEFMKGLIWE